MSETDEFVVKSCLELNAGDEIQAAYKGTIVHRGTVTDLARHHDLFWIIDHLRGGRRLLDLAELEVVKLPAGPAATASSDSAA